MATGRGVAPGGGVIPGPGDRLVPAVSAVLLVSAFPPLHLLIPSFVALVPLAVWIVDRGSDGSAPGDAFRGGVWFGLLYFGLLLHWIAFALVWFTWWAIPAYLAVVSALALCAGSFAWALHRMVRRGGIPLWVALPLAWTALEWLRAHAPGGLAFPWLGLGTSLTAYPELVGSAELVGARGVTLWLAALNGLLAEAVLAARGESGTAARGESGTAARGESGTAARGERGTRKTLAWAAAFSIVLAVPAGWGYWRAATLPVRAIGQVVVVQPNVPEAVKLDRRSAIDSTLAALQRLTPEPEEIPPGVQRSGQTLREPRPELVIWPEATILGPVEVDEELRRRVLAVAERWDAPVLFGAIGRGSEGARESVPFNSAFLTSADGALTGFRYDKHRLVPLVERVPLVPAKWVESEQAFGQYGRGEDWPLGSTRSGARFGTLVCFESAYPEHARRFRREGANVLVNLTNDAWFGREPWYSRTTALWQHPAHLVMRAIENRVGVARAANTGISLFVDPRGRVYERTRLFQPEVLEATVYTSDVVTLYTRTGDVAGPAAMVATLVLLAGAGRVRRPA